MLRRLAVIALALAALIAVPRAADAIPAASAQLQTELTTRRDNDFAGTLTKVQKKQQKAVGQSLGFLLPYLEQSLAEKVGTAGKVAKSLAKAYPAEFAPMNPAGNLRALVAGLVTELVGMGDTATHELEAELPGIHAEKLRAKAAAALAAAQEDVALAQAATDFASALKALKSAAKAIAKGRGYAAQDPPSETVTAALDIVPAPFDAQNVTAYYFPANQAFVINASSQVGNQFTAIEMDGTLSDPFVPGVYTMTGKVHVGTNPGNISTTYYTPNGSIDVSALDPDAATLRATFSFTADTLGNPGPLLVVHVTGGVIDLTQLIVQ